MRLPMPKIISFDGELAYTKKINSAHIFRKYNGIAFSVDVLRRLKPERKFVVEYEGTREHCYFITTVREILNSHLEHVYGGYDRQKVLPLSMFSTQRINSDNQDIIMQGYSPKEVQNKLGDY